MVTPQESVPELASPEGSDMDVSDDEAQYTDPPQNESLPLPEDEDTESVSSFRTAPSSPEISTPNELELECHRLAQAQQVLDRQTETLSNELKEIKGLQESLRIQLLEIQVRSSISRNPKPARPNLPSLSTLRSEYKDIHSEKMDIRTKTIAQKNKQNSYTTRINRLETIKQAGRIWTDQDEIALENLRIERENLQNPLNLFEDARLENARKLDEFVKKVEKHGYTLKAIKESRHGESSLSKKSKNQKRALSEEPDDSETKRTRLTPSLNGNLDTKPDNTCIRGPNDIINMTIEDRRTLLESIVKSMIEHHEKEAKDGTTILRSESSVARSEPTIAHNDPNVPICIDDDDDKPEVSKPKPKPKAGAGLKGYSEEEVQRVLEYEKKYSSLSNFAQGSSQVNSNQYSYPGFSAEELKTAENLVKLLSMQDRKGKGKDTEPLPKKNHFKNTPEVHVLNEIEEIPQTNKTDELQVKKTNELQAVNQTNKHQPNKTSAPQVNKMNIPQANKTDKHPMNNVHFRPYTSIINSMGLNQAQYDSSSIAITKPLCIYESTGGQCNDGACTAAHWRDFQT